MPIEHVATLFRYAGISFIAGSVNHGMFSQERAQLTAAAGVLLFLAGSTLELRQRHPTERRWTAQLGFGVLASIGLGFFTGGLQHFPDSPDRSVWVVPVGFFLSLIAFYFTEFREHESRQSRSPFTHFPLERSSLRALCSHDQCFLAMRLHPRPITTQRRRFRPKISSSKPAIQCALYPPTSKSERAIRFESSSSTRGVCVTNS